MSWFRIQLLKTPKYVCQRLLNTHAKLSPLADAFNYCHLNAENELLNKTTGCFILDDISDSLCRVADLSDCMRMLHPGEAYRYSAQKACQSIGQLACHSPVSFPSKFIPNRQSNSIELIHPLTDHPDSAVRLATYQAYYAPIEGQEKRLEQLLSARHEMAQAAGFKNYAKRSTLHSLAETPENIEEFLQHVCQKLHPIATEVVREQFLPIVKSCYQKMTDNKQNQYDTNVIRP
ncbi:unnamed protein product, partial [Trichobilharzia regenti]